MLTSLLPASWRTKAKFVAGLLGAAITALNALVPFLSGDEARTASIVISVLTAVAVYLTPNAPADQPAADEHADEPDDTGDDGDPDTAQG